MTLALVMLVFACICAAIGARKGNPITGFLVGLLLGPIGVVICLLSGDKNRVPCPQCQEKIMRKALICPHCRSNLQPR